MHLFIDGLRSNVEIISDLSESGLANLADKLRLPRICDTVKSAQSLSEYVGDRSLRRYLFDAVQNGHFVIIDPKVGCPIKSKYSIVLRDKTTFVFFDGLVVCLGALALGYPINGILIENGSVYLKFVDDLWATEQRHFTALAELLVKIDLTKEVAPGTALIGGDINFAHYAWNQLPALQSVIQFCDIAPGVEIISTQEPFGELQKLFPELSAWECSRVDDVGLEDVNRSLKLRLPLGAQFISRSLLERIVRSFQSLSREVALVRLISRVRQHKGKILWMSVRTKNRTPINQEEVLTRIGLDFLTTYPAGLIILDGHSIDVDHELAPVWHREQQENSIREGIDVAKKIKSAIICKSMRVVSVELAIGLPISDSIIIAQYASVYFCHHGTVQHKIGWFSTVPGVVHCNKRSLNLGTESYIKAQSEVAALPVYLWGDYVRSIEATEVHCQGDHQSKVNQSLHTENYFIANLDAASQAVIGIAKSTDARSASWVQRPKFHISRWLLWFRRRFSQC